MANVDVKRKRAIISEFSTTLGYEVVASKGKSATATRQVSLDDGLVAALHRQKTLQAAERLRAADHFDCDNVLTRPDGAPCHPQSLSQTLGRVSKASGLPRLTAHGLRHTSATLMLDNVVHPKDAAERRGHSDPSLFMALHSHVTPTMQEDAAAKLGAALFG